MGGITRLKRPAAGAFVLLVALSLSSCAAASGTDPAQPGSRDASSSASPDAASKAASPAASAAGPVRITFSTQTRTIESPYPIDIDVETPHLTGATAAATAAFDDMASVTTIFTRSRECAKPHYRPYSVTVNLMSGRLVALSDIAKPASDAYGAAAERLARDECEIANERADLQADTAFTPTKAGLVLTWGEILTPSACGVVSITMPWPDARDQAAPGTSLCPSDANLPEGIDSRVCGPKPSDALRPIEVDIPTYGNSAVIASPSGNVVCGLREEFVVCYAREWTFGDPTGPNAATPDPNTDWVPSAMTIGEGLATAGMATGGLWAPFAVTDQQIANAVLPYGKAAAVGRHVCVSQEIGMSCWHTETRHGFFLSRAKYAVW